MAPLAWNYLYMRSCAHFAYYVLARTSCVSSRLDSDLQHLAYVMYISLDAILTGSSDIPGQHGAMSDAIKMRLREVGLADLELLLRHRGITTMYALDHLSSKEASIIPKASFSCGLRCCLCAATEGSKHGPRCRCPFLRFFVSFS